MFGAKRNRVKVFFCELPCCRSVANTEVFQGYALEITLRVLILNILYINMALISRRTWLILQSEFEREFVCIERPKYGQTARNAGVMLGDMFAD